MPGCWLQVRRTGHIQYTVQCSPVAVFVQTVRRFDDGRWLFEAMSAVSGYG